MAVLITGGAKGAGLAIQGQTIFVNGGQYIVP